MSVVLGADGCRGGGWVIGVLDGSGELAWEWAADTVALLAVAEAYDADAVALDVPIGLPALGQSRQCDALARRRLGGRASSVFAAPPREVLACASYAEARAVASSLSAQAFGLVPRIREVDEALRGLGPSSYDRFVEAHPESAFAAMAGALGGVVRLAPKKSAAGALQRLALLQEEAQVPVDVPPGASLDDALDALAITLVARRWAAGTAEVLGDEVDACGLPMRIVV